MQNVPVSRQGGYTLIELVVVIGLLAIIAAIAYPALSSDDSRELDAAAAEIAAAMRFARSESIRTGKAHGFRLQLTVDRIRVFRVDTQVSPWTWIWDVYHPIDKDLHDYSFPAELADTENPISRISTYRGTCDRLGAVYFDANGTPWCLEPETVLLESYRLDIVSRDSSASVSLDGITGRVTVQ